MLAANSDVPFNAGPGQYLQIRARGNNPGSPDRARTGRFRINIVAPVTSDGLLYLTPDAPRLMGGLEDVVTQCGKRSVARQMAEYAYTAIPGGVDVYVTPIVMSGGSAAAFNVYCAGIGAGTVAVGSGQATVRFDDYAVPVDIANGDTPAQIIAKLKAAYDAYIAPTNGSGKGVPFTSGAVVGNALPLTASTAGLVCNDHPVTVQWPAEVTGVAFSPGFLTFAGGPVAAGPGIVTIRCHAKSAVISGIAGPTNVNVATQVVAGANAQTDFPLRLVQRPAPDDDKVDFFYKNGRPAHDIQVTATGINPVTVTYTGETAGSGVPSLSNALNAAVSAEAKQEWVTCFSDSTSLGSLVQHIRTYANGYNQREQFLWWGSTLGLVDAGAIVSGITPSIIYEDNAQGSPGRNTQIICPNTAQPAYALAAMLACARAAEQRMTRNWDGFQLVSNLLPGIPLTYPDVADQLNDSAANQARTTYFMTPLIVRNGNFQVQQFTTTYGGTLPFWSGGYYARGMAYIRQEFLAALAVFGGKEFVRFSAPLSPDVFDTQSVATALYSAAKIMEQGNFYDGADKFKALFAAEVDPINAEWVRVYAPGSPPINNHVIAGQIGPVSV